MKPPHFNLTNDVFCDILNISLLDENTTNRLLSPQRWESVKG